MCDFIIYQTKASSVLHATCPFRCGGKVKLSAKMISWFCGYIYVAFAEEGVGVFCWEKTPCRGLTLHTRSNSPSGRTSAHLLLIYEGHHHGRVRLRCHPRNWLPHHLDLPSSNSSSKGAGRLYCSVTDFENNSFLNHGRAILSTKLWYTCKCANIN